MDNQNEREPQQDDQSELDLRNMRIISTVDPLDHVPEDPDEAEELRIKMLSLQHLSINITD